MECANAEGDVTAAFKAKLNNDQELVFQCCEHLSVGTAQYKCHGCLRS